MERRQVSALVLSAFGLVGIAVSEGYRQNSYEDTVGVQTVGFGTAYVQTGTRMTVEQALVALNKHSEKDQEALRKCFGDALLTQGEWDAYTSLSYNVGAGAVCRSSIVPKVKNKQYTAACQTILEFDKAGGVVLRGLQVRRQREFKTCMGVS